MAVDIRPKLLEKIKSLEGEVEAQQRAIKQAITKGHPVEPPMQLRQEAHIPQCEICIPAMEARRVIVKTWTAPELRTYECAECGQCKTVEIEEIWFARA
jgi:heterodisulfide reductase subunit A-like polyferredoxin